MKSTDMPARYVGGNLVDLLSWDKIYIQLRNITVLHQKTKVTRFELIIFVYHFSTPKIFLRLDTYSLYCTHLDTLNLLSVLK